MIELRFSRFLFRIHISTSISAPIWEATNNRCRPSPRDNYHDGLRSGMLGTGVCGIQLSVWFTGCLRTRRSALGLIDICSERRGSMELLYTDSVILYMLTDQSYKSQHVPVPYPRMNHSERNWAHFSSELCIVEYGTGALWDFCLVCVKTLDHLRWDWEGHTCLPRKCW